MPKGSFIETSSPKTSGLSRLAAKTSAVPVRAKILDFGLARPRQEGQELLTQTGAILGTPSYMAPEQARGLPIDQRADLFSLGCVLYEMSTGKRPFTGADTMAVLTSP